MLISINIELLAEFLSRKTCPNSALSQKEREFRYQTVKLFLKSKLDLTTV